MTQAAGTASSMGVTRTLAANLTVKAATRFPGMPAGLDKAAGTQPAPGPESLSGHRFRASSTFTVTAATMLAHWPVASGRPQGPYRDSRDYSLDCAGLQFPSKVRLQCRPRVPLTEYNGTGKTFVSFQIGDYLKTVVFCSVSKEQNDRTC